MTRHHNETPGSLYSNSPHRKRRRTVRPDTPVLRREQAPRDAKPVPSIEESTQKGPFDPYAFLSLPSTPSLPSQSPNRLTAPGHDSPDVSRVRPKEQNFGHRHSLPFRCSPRKKGSSSLFLGRRATENGGPSLSSNTRTLASNDTSNGVKREDSIPFTPLIRSTTVAPSLQNTQIREQKLEESGVVELDRDEYALQRFIKVNSEMSDLEAILMNGKKKHIFEYIKRNATIKSLHGVEQRVVDNDATPTSSARPTSLREDNTSKKLVNEQHSETVPKRVGTRTETSKGGPASARDAPSTSISDEEKSERPQKEHRPDLAAVHPSRRNVWDAPESSKSHEKEQNALPPKAPPKRKELPGLGLIVNPKPSRPEDNTGHQKKKLPRDLQRREVDMPASKDTVDATNDGDIESAIDSAHDWLQRENALEQEARVKKWVADPNWKHLTTEQIETMRRQGSIPPATFYGHPPRWRAPTGWIQPPVIEEPIFTVAKADEILARLREDRMVREVQRTKDEDTQLAPSRLLSTKGGKETSKPSQGKDRSSNPAENECSPTIVTKKSSRPEAKSTSSGEKKGIRKATGHDIDGQRPRKDDGPAVEPQLTDARDGVGPSKVKVRGKKRKREADVAETATMATSEKVIPESPELPSMKEIMDRSQDRSQVAAASSPAQQKKSKKSSRTAAAEDVVDNDKEPSTASKSKKRKKAKENTEEREVTRDETPTTIKKRKKSGQIQDSNEAIAERARPETLVHRLMRMKRELNARASQEANKEPTQSTIPPPEIAKTKKSGHASPSIPEPAAKELEQPTIDDEDPPLSPQPSPKRKESKSKKRKHAHTSVSESAAEYLWQPVVNDEDPVSSPQASPPKQKQHKSKHDRQTNTYPTVAVNDTIPENIDDATIQTIEPTAPTSRPSPSTRTPFNQHRRRHQSLPPPSTTTANTTHTGPQPPLTHADPTLDELTLLSIRTRIAKLEAAVATRPVLPPNAHTLTPTALAQIHKPLLPREIPPGQTQLSDAELIAIGNMKSKYGRHKAAPYAFSWWGYLYAKFDYLMDWEGEGRWSCKVKSRLKHS